MKTLEPLPQIDLFEMESDKSTSYAEVFLAKTSASLESVPGWRASLADFGLRSPDLFATYDPDLSYWKTLHPYVFGDYPKFSDSFPMSGMMRSGKAYRQCPLALLTYELDNGLLPTPLASETGYRKAPFSQGGTALSTVLGGHVNPTFVEWMMGFPEEWTALLPSEMPSSRKSPK